MIGSTRSRTLPLWYPPFPAPTHDSISSRDSVRRQGCAWCSHPVGRDCSILAATDANLHPTKKERSTFVGGALLDVFPDGPDDRNPLASVRNVAQLMRMRRSNDPELVWCHGHTLQVVVPDEALLVRGDATRRTRVVTNLLTNAAKYEQSDGHISEVAHGGLGIGASLDNTVGRASRW